VKDYRLFYVKAILNRSNSKYWVTKCKSGCAVKFRGVASDCRANGDVLAKFIKSITYLIFCFQYL